MSSHMYIDTVYVNRSGTPNDREPINTRHSMMSWPDSSLMDRSEESEQGIGSDAVEVVYSKER